MNKKISRNKKHKYSKEKKLTLGKEEDTSTLINIAQEDDSILNTVFFMVTKGKKKAL